MLNLTPHEIVVNGVTIPASGLVARVSSVAESVAPYGEYPVVRIKWGEVVGMPENSDVPVIVSNLVASAIRESGQHFPYRVFFPDTGPESVIRDEAGKIIGVRRFAEV
jgi:hypothetical protein